MINLGWLWWARKLGGNSGGVNEDFEEPASFWKV